MSTGQGDYEAHPRTRLVRQWALSGNRNIDVGLTRIVQDRDDMQAYLKETMDMGNFLQHKFLLSCEGNDVATNLKWVLASNSCVLMHPPRFESWLLESQLKPMVHYVPVRRTCQFSTPLCAGASITALVRNYRPKWRRVHQAIYEQSRRT